MCGHVERLANLITFDTGKILCIRFTAVVAVVLVYGCYRLYTCCRCNVLLLIMLNNEINEEKEHTKSFSSL